MPLFKLPNQAEKKQRDKKIIRKSTSSKTKTITKSNKLGDRIEEIKILVESALGKYKDDYVVIFTEQELDSYIKACIKNNVVAIDTETTGLNPLLDKCVGICLYTPNEKPAYIPINHINYILDTRIDEQLTEEQVKPYMDKLSNINVIMFNATFDIRVLKNQIGSRLPCYWDAFLASKLLNENEVSSSLKPLHQKYVLNDLEDEFKFDELFKGITFDKIPIDTAYIYAAHDAIITYELYKYQERFLNEDIKRKDMLDIYHVFRNIEMPVIDVVVDMEDSGVSLDLDYTKEISKKYNELLSESLTEVYSLMDPYSNKIQSYRNKFGDESKLSDPINIDSPTQLAILYYDIMETQPVDKRKPRGTGEEILKKLGDPLSKSILKYRGIKKLLTTYIDKMPNVINPNDGRVHCKFNQYGAATGRFSCISEGTIISSPSGNKPIEDMKEGDWVYCYDENNRLTLSKVKHRWFTGVRNCVKLKWESKYNKKCKGELICTPDHFIKTIDGWKMAKDLTPKDHILYVHRREDKNNIALYAINGQGAEEEHSWIKKYYFNCFDTNTHLHHCDGNHKNNNPDNLTLVNPKVHNNTHLFNDGTWNNGYNFSYDELIELGESVNWELNKLPYDIGSTKSWFEKYRINYIEKYTESYSKRPYKKDKHGGFFKNKHLPISKSNLIYALELSNGNTAIAAGYFGISVLEFENACDKNKLLSNHNIISIEYLNDPYNVFDLEIEDYHNFIANELCVHNSSDPNLQNIPSRNHDIRKMFIATHEEKIVNFDTDDFLEVDKFTEIFINNEWIPISRFGIGDTIDICGELFTISNIEENNGKVRIYL